MAIPALYADFNNADPQGRLRLNCVGTFEDLERLHLELRDRLQVRVHDEELEADGEVSFSADEHIWVARIDWDAIRQFAG
ncbi:MAG TPA: hypothetical protein VN641_07365 [Urbifossiella sp.]|nr:hypothetical protein [Urbifossiella sp.]